MLLYIKDYLLPLVNLATIHMRHLLQLSFQRQNQSHNPTYCDTNILFSTQDMLFPQKKMQNL